MQKVEFLIFNFNLYKKFQLDNSLVWLWSLRNCRGLFMNSNSISRVENSCSLTTKGSPQNRRQTRKLLVVRTDTLAGLAWARETSQDKQTTSLISPFYRNFVSLFVLLHHHHHSISIFIKSIWRIRDNGWLRWCANCELSESHIFVFTLMLHIFSSVIAAEWEREMVQICIYDSCEISGKAHKSSSHYLKCVN